MGTRYTGPTSFTLMNYNFIVLVDYLLCVIDYYTVSLACVCGILSADTIHDYIYIYINIIIVNELFKRLIVHYCNITHFKDNDISKTVWPKLDK